MAVGKAAIRELRLGAAIFVALLVIGSPFLIAAHFWSAAMQLAVFGGVTAAMATLSAGPVVSLRVCAAFAVIAPIAVFVHTQPFAAAALVAIVGGGVAHLARWGYQGAALLVAVFVPYLIHEPPSPWPGGATTGWYYLAIAVTVAAAGAWATLLVHILTRRHKLAPLPQTPLPEVDVLLATVLIAVAVGGVTLIALTWFPTDMWVWLTLTIFILTKPTADLNLKRVRDRSVGTLLGAAGGALLLSLPIPTAVTTVVAVVSMTTALTLMVTGKAYWIYATALTPAVILFDTTGQDGIFLAEQRLGFTVAGAVIAVGLSALINYVVSIRRRAFPSVARESANG